jgi:hypothetical protein
LNPDSLAAVSRDHVSAGAVPDWDAETAPDQ